MELFYTIIEQAEDIADKKLDLEYKDFLCNFYVEAIAGLFVNWIKDREHHDREKMIEYISNTVRCSLMGVLDSFNSENIA